MYLLCLSVLLAGAPLAATGFVVRDMAGNSHALADYRGQWLVVNYWATWCPPCLEEIPDLIALDEARADVVVIGIAVDYKSRQEVERFVDDNLISYPVVLGDKSVLDQFGPADVLPTTYIYDPRGVLVKRHRGLITRNYIERMIARYRPGESR